MSNEHVNPARKSKYHDYFNKEQPSGFLLIIIAAAMMLETIRKP